MATNRTRRIRKQKETVPFSEELAKMLLFREVERGTPEWSLYVSRHFDQGAKLREAWEAHKRELMKTWAQSGREGLPWVVQYLQGRDLT